MPEKLRKLTEKLEIAEKDKASTESLLHKYLHEYVVHYMNDLNEKLNRSIADIMGRKSELILKYQKEEIGDSNRFQIIKGDILKEVSKVSYRNEKVKQLISDYIYDINKQGKRRIFFNSVIPGLIPEQIYNILIEYGFMEEAGVLEDRIRGSLSQKLVEEADNVLQTIQQVNREENDINRLKKEIETEQFIVKELTEFTK